MSNYMALATVTATLSQLVQEAINGHPPMLPTVTHIRPDGSGLPTTGVNIFLYQVTTNAAWRNVDLPARNAEGRLITRPKVALDLHYLLTFFGDETVLEPQRLLGLTVSGIHAKPVLTREQITAAVDDPSNSYIADSDLAREVELVKFTPLPLSLEELSKLWSVFFQTHYTLSIAYHATVVLLDGAMVPVKPLPVRMRNFYTIPYYSINVDRIASTEGLTEPIYDTSSLSITGRGLRGDTTKVRIGGEEVTPTSVDDTEIVVPLSELSSDALRAGVQGLQVVHQLSMGGPPSPTLHDSVESSVVPFVLRPRVFHTIVAGTVSGVTTVPIQVFPDVAKEQRVLVHLNKKDAVDATSYSYTVRLAADTDTIPLTFADGDVPTGTYLVRVQIDGAESLLDVDPTTNTYSGPTVDI